MRIISTAWIPGSLQEFEAHCALPVHEMLGYGHGSTPLDIFILAGMEKLSEDFIARQSQLGIKFHDATALTAKYVEAYGGLIGQLTASQGALYELYCYIRWLVVEEILQGEPFVHVDLDLFFQKPLDEISRLFTGVTGTFGSPCLTAVSDLSWLSAYKGALDSLLTDRPGFQASLGYGGNEFRSDISSDQDLVHALEVRDMLPRIGIDELAESYSIFVNPLWPYMKAKPEAARLFEVVDGVDMIGNKPVLFWHLQNNAADYLSRFAVLENYKQSWLSEYLPCKLGLPFIQLNPTAENFAFQALRDHIWPKIAEQVTAGRSVHDLGFEKFFSRTWVSEWFIVQKGGRGLFSSAYWWEDGVFV